MDLGTFETLLVEQDGDALVVTVNRPSAMNALAGQVIADLETLTLAVESQVGSAGRWPVKGIIVTGAGDKAFVAGADIVEMQSMSPDEGEAYSRRMQGVTERLEALPLPVIAAVNGFALGGGCELAMACDWIYASDNARFGQPEVSLGLVPGFGGSVRMARRVGAAMARELIFTGRMVKADEALRIGLVNRVYADPAALLERVHDQAPQTLAAVLRRHAQQGQVELAAAQLGRADVELAQRRRGGRRGALRPAKNRKATR